MKKWLKKYIPSTQSMMKSGELKGIKSFLKASCFWSRDKQAVARGVAAGLAGCVIPGFQFFYAAILVILLRGNFPIALLCTFVTNPLTVVPITTLIYFVGTLIIKNGKTNTVIQHFHWDFSSFHAFFSNVSAWIFQFGKAFLIGLPIVSIGFGLIGYFGTIFIWNISSHLSHRKKAR